MDGVDVMAGENLRVEDLFAADIAHSLAMCTLLAELPSSAQLLSADGAFLFQCQAVS